MNKQMIGGLIRHLITVVAGGIVAGNTETLNVLFTNLITNISSGDIGSIAATGFIIFSVLWSMWVKASEGTKQSVIKTLTFSKGV
jgi:hypothetical protein